ncbi:MAG: amidophosphoribosyltransferase [Ardenticatenales bacterium]|nr:amidophosphoribosyltransferase [Ardenticatenales bacterium]
MVNTPWDDSPKEECGIFGIFAPGLDVARTTYFGLYALQHRGQEGAGIVTYDGRVAHIHKGMGLVAQVFNEENMSHLLGHMAVGHTRYSTTGSNQLRNAQPYLIETLAGPLAIVHNGNLTNAPMLRRNLLQRGVGLSSSSDTEIIVHLLAGSGGSDWQASIRMFMAQAEGAYSLVILTKEAIYGVRDPWGFRPLVLGKLEEGYLLASESCAFSTIGATMVREILPGEIVRIDKQGYEITQGAPAQPRALCTFEHIYFARPDSIIDAKSVHHVRQALGRQLAREAPADADIVVPVPDSGTPHAIGYAQESGLPYTEGLIKNRYIGRTFIQPSDQLRRASVAMKFNPLPANLQGKRVVIVDDSIVRGTTSGPLVQLLREGGATEVHMRVACPPIMFPCFMGVDMATQAELIAAQKNLEGIRSHINADSLAYLSIDGMMQAIGESGGYCNACFTGSYPIPVTLEIQDKEQFEGVFGCG